MNAHTGQLQVNQCLVAAMLVSEVTRHGLADRGPRNYAHRYLSDGRIEFICISCLKAICVVRTTQAVDSLLDAHLCGDTRPL